jgi:hypothetical protein
VIPRAGAAEIVLAFLSRPDPSRNERVRFAITRIDERPSSWVVYYASEGDTKPLSSSAQPTGSGVVMVSKTKAKFVTFGTSEPTDDQIVKTDAELADEGKI